MKLDCSKGCEEKEENEVNKKTKIDHDKIKNEENLVGCKTAKYTQTVSISDITQYQTTQYRGL